MLRYSPGKTLAEYGLILALVVLVAIPAVSLLGEQLSAGISNSASSVSQADALFGLLGASAGGSGGSVEVTGGDGQMNPENKPDTLTPQSQILSSGAELGVAGMTTSVQGDSSGLVRDSGTSGATKALASEMDTLINNALISGEITPAQATTLKNLSNQGHTIANVEKMIEDHIAAGLKDQPITYNGTTYQNAFYLAWKEVGFDGQPMSQYQPMDAPGAGAEMAEFQQLYKEAAAQGLTGTQVGEQVLHLANEIAHIGESTDDVLSLQGDKITSVEAYYELSAATITNQHSSAICTAGTNTTSGTACK